MDNPFYAWETPLLIVECLSPANRKGNVRDLLNDYRSIRTPHVWLLRPEDHVADLYSGQNAPCRIENEGTLSFLAAKIPLEVLWKAFEDRV